MVSRDREPFARAPESGAGSGGAHGAGGSGAQGAGSGGAHDAGSAGGAGRGGAHGAGRDERPRFSVIDSTTPSLSLAEAVAVYGAAGVEGIGITESTVDEDVDAAAALVRAGGLEVTGCFLGTSSILPAVPRPESSPNGVSRPDLDTPRARLDDIAGAMRRLAPLRPEYFYTLSGPRGDRAPEDARATVAEGLRELCAVAASLGAGLALEVFHPTLEDWSFVNTIRDAVALLDAVDAANFSLALDVWHLGEGEAMLGDLRAVAPRVASLHVNDRRDPTRSVWDRVLPGDGVASIRGMLGSLEAGGFAGWYELEILSDDGRVERRLPGSLWELDPAALVERGRRGFLELWRTRSNGAKEER